MDIDPSGVSVERSGATYEDAAAGTGATPDNIVVGVTITSRRETSVDEMPGEAPGVGPMFAGRADEEGMRNSCEVMSYGHAP